MATEATSWPILSVTRRPGAMFKVPRLFIWDRDRGRWVGVWGGAILLAMIDLL